MWGQPNIFVNGKVANVCPLTKLSGCKRVGCVKKGVERLNLFVSLLS